MPGGIVLAGGDEFRPGCEEMDSAVLGSTGARAPRVLVIPTAAVTGPQKAASDGVRYFSSLGAQSSALMVLDKGHAEDEEVLRQVPGASVLYFTGGNPDHLLDTLRGSRLLEALLAELEGGAVVGGSSAGAMVMGSLMRSPASRKWVPALGVAGELAVLPHHERSDPATVAADLATNAPPGLRVLGIDAGSCCLGMPGTWTVLGPGKVTAYEGGSWSTYTSGQTLPPQF